MAVEVQDPKQAIKASYGAAAEGWKRWSGWYDRNFGPSFDWCCDAIGIGPGAVVLDVGCGTGQPTIRTARRVQPGGRVIATDIAPEMVHVARARAEEAGLDNVEFAEMDAEQLQLEDESFDAVTFCYGLMFCPDPGRAIAEARRVLKPGGRYAVIAWDDPSKSPFITIAGQAVARYFPATAPSASAPHVFRFAQRGTLEQALRAGGFALVSVESRPMVLECSSPEEYWHVFTDHAAGIKTKIAQLSAADEASLRASVDAAAAPFMAGGRLKLTATPLCAVAVK